MRSLVVTLLIACLLPVAGCQTYKEGGGRTPGEITDDLGIQTAVKSALIRDAQIKGLAIDVDVSRSVVTLYGRVPSAQAREKAVALAAGVRGVVEVVDRLTLVEPK